jgi:hypothetical protein
MLKSQRVTVGDIKDIEEMIKKEEVYTDILNDIYDIYN